MSFTIAVTGAAGRLGQVLVPLIEKKYKTRLLVRNKEDLLRGRGRSQFVEINLEKASVEDMRRAIKGVNCIVHLAGLVDLRAKREKLFAVNYSITEKLLMAAMAERVKFFIHTSSISVYADSDKLISENSAKKPVTVYGESKLAAERAVTSSHLDWVVLRPGLIYGPHFKEGFIQLIEQMKNKRAAIIGTGDNNVPLVFEGDVAKAFVKSIDLLKTGNKRILRQAFNVVGEPVTQREAFTILSKVFVLPMPVKRVSINFAKTVASLYSFVSKLTGKQSAFPPEYVELLARNRVYDVRKAKKFFGFVASTPLRKGMQAIRKEWA